MALERFDDVRVGEVFRFYSDPYAFPYRKIDAENAELIDPTLGRDTSPQPARGDRPVIRDQKHHHEPQGGDW